MKRSKPAKKPAVPARPAARHASAWPRIELAAGLLITLWIIFLHVNNLIHVGPLWRDEVGTIDFASMPTFGDIWRNLRYDNFPPLFVLVARSWMAMGFSSDLGCHVLGLIIGLGIIATIWFAARSMSARVPLLALAMIGANPLLIRVGDSLRPYGLGIALTILTMCMLWKFVSEQRCSSLVWATVSATLSVQCLYQCASFVFAFCCGAWMVAVGQKNRKLAVQIGMIGAVAALSLLPHYANIKNSQEWFGISRLPITVDTITSALEDALKSSGGLMPILWAALFIGGIGLAAYRMIRRRQAIFGYAAIILLILTPLFFFFLKELGLATRSWYFLIFLTPVTLLLDVVFAELNKGPARIAIICLAVAVVFAGGPTSYAGTKWRQSNVDLVAAKLKESDPADLIIVSPWYFGVSLQRYLDVKRWTTIPPMEELAIHRYDLMKKAMMSENPVAPIVDKMRTALSSGHKVWIAGVFQTPPGGNPQPIQPPYTGGLERADSVYFSSWMFEVSYFAQQHAVSGGVVKVPVPDGAVINPLEDVPLVMIQGWHN